jgi:hypothetical protein
MYCGLGKKLVLIRIICEAGNQWVPSEQRLWAQCFWLRLLGGLFCVFLAVLRIFFLGLGEREVLL